MTTTILGRLTLLTMLAAPGGVVGAQLARVNSASTHLPALGEALVVSAVRTIDRATAGVLGSEIVAVRSNSPWELQARLFAAPTRPVDLAAPTDPVRDVLVRGASATISAGAWRTIARGGATNRTIVPVNYVVGKVNPAAEVRYRVVAAEQGPAAPLSNKPGKLRPGGP